MALLPLILLAIIQGITEFLPISSSGHLMILHALMEDAQDWQTRTIIDVSLHLGTLVAVLIYFRESVKKMLQAGIALLQGKTEGNAQGRRLALNILSASIPVLVVGYIVHKLEPSWLLMVEIVAWTTLLFGIVLWIADSVGGTTKKLDDMSTKDALLIGLAQTLALIPGTSRAGITMTAARFIGYSRTESAEFSLLLAIISITGAGTLSSIDLIKTGDFSLWFAALLGGIIAMFTAWATIAVMMDWLSRASFAPFALYRIFLGCALLILIYSGIWSG